MLPKLRNLINAVLCFGLSLFYSSWIGLGVLISYIFMRNTKMWTVNERPNPPKPLVSDEFGKHKFAHVNVRTLKFHFHLKESLSDKKIFKYNLNKF